MQKEVFSRIPEALLPWYCIHKRDLPWRRDTNPYHIWISEIMLQQTRVEAVKGYYLRFLSALPDIASLANCDDALLLKLWEGLGYYNRVRNMKKAAQIIEREHGGSFPSTYDSVLKLPGIGDYTAGAICSIAYNMPVAAVDGNVLRVIARLTNDATPINLPEFKKKVKQELENIYPAEAGAFTQALMELGATICGPNKAPSCNQCPCLDFCLGAKKGTANSLPVKLPPKEKRLEEKTILILKCGSNYALCKRDDKGLLAGLWQFPNMDGLLEANAVVERLKNDGITVSQIYMVLERNHIFTHIKWDMRAYYLEVADMGSNYSWFDEAAIEANTALPTAFRKFWDLR